MTKTTQMRAVSNFPTSRHGLDFHTTTRSKAKQNHAREATVFRISPFVPIE